MSDLPKAYDPSLVEEKWQSRWIEEGCFKADPASEKPAYSVVIPPPNVTGVLHLGHVLNNTIQDILVRRARQNTISSSHGFTRLNTFSRDFTGFLADNLQTRR